MTDANPFDSFSQKTEPQQPSASEPNPFDNYARLEASLTEAPRPTSEQFAQNAFEKGRGGKGGLFTHAADVYQQKREERIVSRADTEGVAQPGDVFSSKPTQGEVDLAMANLAARKAEHDRIYSFPEPQTLSEELGAASGSLNAGLTAPENLLPLSRVGKAVEMAGSAIGVNEVAANIAARGFEMGAFSGAANAAEQGLDIAAGHQANFDRARVFESALFGAGFGASMPAIAAAARAYKGHFPTQINYWETQPVPTKQSDLLAPEGKSGPEVPGKIQGEVRPLPEGDATIDEVLGPTVSDGGEISSPPVRPPEVQPREDTTVGDILGEPETGPVPGEVTETPTESNGGEATTPPPPAPEPTSESPKPPENATTPEQDALLGELETAHHDFHNQMAGAKKEALASAGNIKGKGVESFYKGFDAGFFGETTPKTKSGKAGYEAGKAFRATEEGNAASVKLAKLNDAHIKYKKATGEWFDQTQSSDFKNWFSTSRTVDKSNKPIVYYHATTNGKDFRVFKQGTANSIFASPDPKFTGYFHGSSPSSGGSIYPVYIKALNAFDYENKEHVEALVNLLKKTVYYSDHSTNSLRNNITNTKDKGNWAFLEGKIVQKAIKELGHDGYYVNERINGVRAKNIAVYEPTQVKSAIGNRGTFDPKDPDITHFKVGDEVNLANADVLEAKSPQKGVAANVDDVRFSNRGMYPRELAPEYGGVSAKEELNHRLDSMMREIAASLGFKFEKYDPNYNVRKALGTYHTRVGTIRIRYAGDLPIFIHELGHAMDFWMRDDARTKAAWFDFIKRNKLELLPLDLNWQLNGFKGSPSIAEGIAEFTRAYVTNPAFAEKMAPNSFAEFKSVLSIVPEIDAALTKVQSMAHIESRLEPTQVFTTMLAEHEGFSHGMGHRTGTGIQKKDFTISSVAKSLRQNGVVVTFKDYAHTIYAGVVASDHAFARFTQGLIDAGFRETGKARGLTFKNDPYVQFRKLPGAEQEYVAAIKHGWRSYGSPLGPRVSPSVEGALQKALRGEISRLENQNDPMVRAFNGYLIARRAITEWERWEAGELLNQPVRASKNETLRAISDFEAAYPQFRDAADDIFAFRRAQFERAVDAGLIPLELAQKVLDRRIDHIPFWRDYSADAAAGGSGKGVNLEYHGLHSFKGSTRDIINPIMSIIEDAANHSRRIAENEVYKTLDKLAKQAGKFGGAFWERVPNSVIKGDSVDIEEAISNIARIRGISPDDAKRAISNLQGMIGEDLSATIFRPQEITKDGKRVLFFWEGGKRVAVRIGDSKIARDFYDLMTMMSSPERDMFANTVSMMNSLFQSSIVHAPRFITGTMVRDNMTRVGIPRYMGMLGRIPGVQDAVGLYTLLFDKAFFRSYAENGGIRGGIYSHAKGEFSKGNLTHGLEGRTAETLLDKPGALLWNIAGDKISAAGRNPAKLLKATLYDTPIAAFNAALKFTETGETVSRIGVAKLTNKYLKEQGLTDEEALMGAIHEANDVLDYSRKGANVQTAARMFVFLNAGIQGADRALRSSIGEPLIAAVRMLERKGWDNLDAKDKYAIEAASKNFFAVSAMAAAWLTYRAQIKDQPFYAWNSEYMKENYMLLPLGQDKYGNYVGASIHKPYDWPGAVINMFENLQDELMESDPVNWSHVLSGLKEAVPRQFHSVQDLLSSSPPTKLAYELTLKQKMGFAGMEPKPIVPPEIAERGKPEDQYANYTSETAKWLGSHLGVSPMLVDHVINSMGTSAQDYNDMSTAMIGNNPLVTPSDTMTRLFIGQIYRTQRGAPGIRADMEDLVAKDHGTYQIQANAYLNALKDGDPVKADQVYNRADEGAKTFMTIQSSSNFGADVQQLHPLEHAQAVARVMHGLMSRLNEGLVEVHSERYKKGEEHQTIHLNDEQSRMLNTQFNMIVAEETKNGLSIMKQPGYEDFKVTDTSPRLNIIRQISPEVADETEAMLSKAHIIPATALSAVWPEVKDRLLKDKDQAYLSDLRLKTKFGLDATLSPVQ